MTQLSKREKLLLFLLAVVAVVIGGFALLVRPALDRRTQLQETLSSEQMTQATMMADIAGAPAAAQAREDARLDARHAAEIFYEPMSNAQLTELCKSFLDARGIVSSSMSLTGTHVGTVSWGGEEQAAADTYAFQEHLAAAEGDGGAPEDASLSAGVITSADVLVNTVTIQGPAAQAEFRALLTDLSGRTPIRVQSFSYAPDQGTFNLVIDFYMLKQVA